jgi:xanthine dehydrogenase YagS FAD-binding subunit
MAAALRSAGTCGVERPPATASGLLTIVHPFTYHRAGSLSDATARLAAPGVVPLGGGTDLLVTIKESLATPASLVDLRSIRGMADVVEREDGSVRIGAAARVQHLATHELIRRRFRVLAEACDSVGSTALRFMGTIGGNLCQRPRCWYFRRNIPCLKNEGSSCPAVEGENQYHAIFGGGPCYIVHPSDPAVALTALGAAVELESVAGRRSLPIDEFYVLPADRLDHETVLRPGEIVGAVAIPGGHDVEAQRYYKLMQRGSWDFALVSLAAVRRVDGQVRLVLGGVAPKPWRVAESVEEDVASGGLDEHDAETLAERALYDARPLAKNGYKVSLAAALLRRAILDLAGA